jgi:hypothetical protein
MTKGRATLGSTGIFADPPPDTTPPPKATARAKRAAPSAPATRPDRQGKVALPFWTTAAAKKQLRMLAAAEDTTQQHLMAEALNLLFKDRGKPPIS